LKKAQCKRSFIIDGVIVVKQIGVSCSGQTCKNEKETCQHSICFK